MKVIVTGAKGQLAQDVLRQLEHTGLQVYGVDREELDITNNEAVQAYINKIKPDAIMHCAAYTNVDAAEEDADTAYKVNGLGTKYLAQAAGEIGAKMLYISTDYVFNGTAKEPYKTSEPTKPLGVYGETKLAGETFVQQYVDKFFIVRTAWVFGIFGNNFVKTMLRLGREHDEISVVHDQVGSPTYTVDLARFMIELISSEKYGIYHATNAGICSWYEFAVEIFKQAEMDINVKPVTTEEFPRPADRPKYSVLDKKKIEEEGFLPLQDWKKAVACYLSENR
ncbi:dTDP-4-dehydrorhamnose reductase [Bacillus thuringiensis]|uniref:dTDP-4-dehydrorhamnose reductase n=1 Tax=Bacillus thuringiensis TaxID=1428 RepID=UPI001FAB9281|nr:dTDP-4-dehydrorhamnose reductase [Bacillus thuringiensis]MDM8359967.1 dTDP-4-dehydrorhamnose reductase [Bacillus thuringiensis]